MNWRDRREETERRLHFAVDDFIGHLRLARGLDEQSYEGLCNALIALGDAWREEAVLPKRVVNMLVGLYSWIYSASYLYGADEASKIRRSAMEIEGLIFRSVVPASEDDWS